MRCTQYKFISNLNFSFEESQIQDQVLRNWHERKRNHLLINDEPDFTNASWINSYHVYEKDKFIPTIRDGLGGPIISYWARVDNNRRWFAAPIVKLNN